MHTIVSVFIHWISCQCHKLYYRLKSRVDLITLYNGNNTEAPREWRDVWDMLDRDSSHLPSWFDRHRVQGHTRLPIVHSQYGLETKAFTCASKGFKRLGAKVFTRHVKSGTHRPWWRTSMPPGYSPSISEDLLIDTYEPEKSEPPRVCRRLQNLRTWSHEKANKVFPRDPGASRPDGIRART